MLDGHGHNNPDYLPQLGFLMPREVFVMALLGINEAHGMAFNPSPHKDDMAQNSRWGEQWLPHSAWFLLAIIAQYIILIAGRRVRMIQYYVGIDGKPVAEQD